MSWNVVQLIPDSPYCTRQPFFEPGVTEHERFAEISHVQHLVGLVREQITISVAERDSLLEADPETGMHYRSSFRVSVPEATEFECRNAANIVNGLLSPGAKVEVTFEKVGAMEGSECSIMVYPKELGRS